jgi:hypothetical protein
MYKTIVVDVDGSAVTGMSWTSDASLAGPVYPALIDASFDVLRKTDGATWQAGRSTYSPRASC